MIRRACPLVAAVILVGCNGGTVDRQDLSKDGESLDSTACEAMLVSQGVERGRTTATFTREHSATLRVQTSNLADALAHRTAVHGLEVRTRALAQRAARLAGLLQRLHEHSGDRAVAAELDGAFKRFGSCK